MALSLGSGRRRWPCRAALRGGKGGAGCRHFHVHYHFPRQVCAFSSLRLPFSLLSSLLILPVLFLALLAFLVCFGWFTLVYFMSSLLGKCNSPECIESDRDTNDLCRNEEQARNKDDRAGNCVAEGTGGSAMVEACIEGQHIKEVLVDGFSNASLDMSSRMASPHDCTKDEEHSSCEKLVEEVMVSEANRKEFNEISYLDVSSDKQHLQDTIVDSFVEEIGTRESCTTCATSNLVHTQTGQEFVESRKEAPPYAESEILEFIDKHETRAVIVIFPDNSAENYVKCGADLPDEIFAKKLPEDIVHEQQDVHNTVTDLTKKLCEDHFIEEKGKQIFGISDETHDVNNESEMSRLPLDTVNDNKYSPVDNSNASFHLTNSDEEDRHEKELTEDNRAQASGTTSLVCDFAENNQAIREDIGVPSTEDNIVHEVASEESSVIGRVVDEDENSCMSEGGPRRLPLVRRSRPPWWNLCGVLDVFAGCKD